MNRFLHEEKAIHNAMQALDYPTLYIVLVMNTTTLTVIWLGISLAYRDFISARYWMGGSLLTTAGAIFLSFQFISDLPLFVIAGNFLVILGFWFFYIGLQVFYRRKINTLLIQLTIIMGISLCAALLVYNSWLWQTAIHGLTYLAALISMMVFVVWRHEKTPGIYVCIAALLVSILCQIFNLILTSQIAYRIIILPEFFALYSYNFLLMQFSGGLLTFGFFILTIDALRKEVEHLASRDDLTGLPNRSQFNSALNSAEQHYRSTQQSYAILMIDIDNFKSFNDRYGHKLGDDVLQHFCKITSALLKPDQIMSRHGGDEFCILLTKSDHEETEGFALSIKQALAATPFILDDKPLAVTVSTGVVVRSDVADNAIESMFYEADKALYRVKGNGRNGYDLYRPNRNIVRTAAQ